MSWKVFSAAFTSRTKHFKPHIYRRQVLQSFKICHHFCKHSVNKRTAAVSNFEPWTSFVCSSRTHRIAPKISPLRITMATISIWKCGCLQHTTRHRIHFKCKWSVLISITRRVDVCRKRALQRPVPTLCGKDAIIPKSVVLAAAAAVGCLVDCTTNSAELAEKLILNKYFRNGEHLEWQTRWVCVQWL